MDTKNKILKNYYKVILFIIFSLANASVYAQGSLQDNIQKNTRRTAKTIGFDENTNEYDLMMRIADIVQIITSLLGILFLILIIVSGIQWMTAGGNEDTVKKSKARIKNAIYGLVIVVFSYLLVTFIESVFKYNGSV